MKNKLILLCCLCSLNVLAEEGFSEADFYDQMPVVLAANRIPQSYINSASSITIISKEMIEAMGARNVPEILAIVPGFQSVYVYGNEPVSTYHGLGDRFQRRFQVLIDNRSVYTPLYGGVAWANLPLSVYDIEKIEIIRGPNSAVFGSNSFSAVISITTKHSKDDSGLSALLANGDQAWKKAYFRYAAGNATTSYSLSVENASDNGLDNLNDNQQGNLTAFRLDSDLNQQTSLQMQFGGKHQHKEIGTTNYRGSVNTGPVHEVPVDSYYFRVALENKPAEESLFRIQYYRNQYQDKNRFEFNYPPGIVSVNQDVTEIRDDFEALYNYNRFKPFKLLLGMGSRKDTIQSYGYFSTDEQQVNNVLKLFSQVEWKVNENIILNAGLMYEDNKIAGIQNVPKLSAIYKLDNSSSLRMNYSMATRAPVLFEYSADQRLTLTTGSTEATTVVLYGNRNIMPEKITALELGYLKYFSATHSIDIKLFEEQLSDLILYQPDVLRRPEEQIFSGTPTASFDNSGKVTIRGLETQWDYQLTGVQHIYAQLTWLDVSGYDATNGPEKIPQISYSLLWTAQIAQKQQLSIKLLHYDKFRFTNSESANPTNINNLDMAYKYRFKLNRQDASLSLGVKNMLGVNTEFNASATNDIAQTRQFLYAVFRANIF